jgi:hypothetical protein
LLTTTLAAWLAQGTAGERLAGAHEHGQGGDHGVAGAGDVEDLAGLGGHMVGALGVEQGHALFRAGQQQGFEAQGGAQALRQFDRWASSRQGR